ncbi:MAG: XdhC family protein [Gemmatimonadota bacterium]|nr:XdhC family protein [Gemmatimonadota bacterium]
MESAERVSVADAARAALDALRGGEPVVAAVMLDGAGSELGRRMLIWRERCAGTLGDAVLNAAASDAASALLAGDAKAGPVRVEDGRTFYLEMHHAPPELVIVGAGHIARPLCRVGAMLGFRVLVLDDRPEFATRDRFPEAEEVRRADFSDPFRGISIGPRTHLVLVTRGHKYDYEALRELLLSSTRPAYVGMIGSRRRVRAALEQLSREEIPRERLEAIHAPVGLDIGAETPEEIAVAIAAELVRVRRGGTGVPLRDHERVLDRWIAPR